VEPGSHAISLLPLLEGPGEGIVHTLTGPDTGNHQIVGSDHPSWGEEMGLARVDGRHRRVSRDDIDYLLEVKSGPPRLVVCGAGHDAVPLVRLGHEMGFEVMVVDDRRPFLTLERFPEASALVHCAPADLATHIEGDPRTSFVIMSHNYLRDVDFLGSLLGQPAAYVGCLGPGERLERMLKDLAAAGRKVTAADRAHLHGPAGLDLGAEGPTEIALSVLAEILAVRRAREGGFLVDKKGPAELRRLP
jgi:xanthine dehydrogenase accessory factor